MREKERATNTAGGAYRSKQKSNLSWARQRCRNLQMSGGLSLEQASCVRWIKAHTCEVAAATNHGEGVVRDGSGGRNRFLQHDKARLRKETAQNDASRSAEERKECRIYETSLLVSPSAWPGFCTRQISRLALLLRMRFRPAIQLRSCSSLSASAWNSRLRLHRRSYEDAHT
jgi:hypothetical protein